ncbi:MAG: hypothetical protein JNN20_04100, partial [Betaproteobacteria bacterium]|nr:hypothetical protein [Betaproteobacteria bacterium]
MRTAESLHFGRLFNRPLQWLGLSAFFFYAQVSGAQESTAGLAAGDRFEFSFERHFVKGDIKDWRAKNPLVGVLSVLVETKSAKTLSLKLSFRDMVKINPSPYAPPDPVIAPMYAVPGIVDIDLSNGKLSLRNWEEVRNSVLRRKKEQSP